MKSTLSAFTLAETVISLTILGIATSAIYSGLTRINEFASANRLYSCASAIVADRIDRSLAVSPFNPTDSQIPPELVVGNATTPNVAIYTDPNSGEVLVSGSLITTVTSTSVPVTSSTSSQSISLQQTDVQLKYQFHGKTYQVRMTSLRSSDS